MFKISGMSASGAAAPAVVIADPLRLWRDGAAVALARWPVHQCDPADLLPALREFTPRLVVLTLAAPQEWRTIADVIQLPSPPLVVAVLADADADSFAVALRAGAVGVLPRNCSSRQLRHVVSAALRGRVQLPIAVLLHLLDVGQAPVEPQPNDADRALIAALASGMTVARLAEQEGYSERAMFRHLKQLYTRFGVLGRHELLETAHRRGWL
jgi:DNA-binding NarL/FixJ family response regulator